MEEKIFQRQRAFLAEYTALLPTISEIEEKLPGKRAQELVHKLAENGSGSAQLDTERRRTRNSQSYAVKSSSYAAPERYLSFYRFLERAGTEEPETCIRQVEELYRLELCLIFRNRMDALNAKLRFLLKRLPESGGFVVEGGADAAEETIRAGAGRILSRALLWAAAQRVNDWEVYDLLHRLCGMPMLVSTGISGRSTTMSAQIPFSDVSELCSSMCADGKAVTPREVRALLRMLERFPRGIAADSLKILYQAVSQARETASHQSTVEKEREARQKLYGLAGKLDQLEGEIEAMLGDGGRESGAP